MEANDASKPALVPATEYVSSSPAVPPRVAMRVSGTSSVEARISDVLLPTEHFMFATRPHPVAFVGPIFTILIGTILFTAIATAKSHPIINGHHVTMDMFQGGLGALARLVAIVIFARGVLNLKDAVWYFFGYRIATTTRRAFVMSGLFGRRLRPLANASMAVD